MPKPMPPLGAVLRDAAAVGIAAEADARRFLLPCVARTAPRQDVAFVFRVMVAAVAVVLGATAAPLATTGDTDMHWGQITA